MLLYLGYVLGPPCWSLFGVHSFHRAGDTGTVQLITAKTPPTKPNLLELAYPWIGFTNFLICFTIEGISYMLVFILCL